MSLLSRAIILNSAFRAEHFCYTVQGFRLGQSLSTQPAAAVDTMYQCREILCTVTGAHCLQPICRAIAVCVAATLHVL